MVKFRLNVTSSYAEPEESQWFTKSLNHLLDQDYNFLCAIVGRTRGGKSWAALKIAEKHDPTFTPEVLRERMVSNVKDFARNILADLYPPRCFVIFDEAGEIASSRKYRSNPNETLRAIGITFGFRKICVLWITPNLAQVDKDQRRLIHAIIKLEKRGFAEVRRVASNYLDREWHYSVGTMTLGSPTPAILQAYAPLKEADFRSILGKYVK